MEKARRPNVVRTWTVERTRVLHRQPQPVHFDSTPRRRNFRGPTRPSRGSGPTAGH